MKKHVRTVQYKQYNIMYILYALIRYCGRDRSAEIDLARGKQQIQTIPTRRVIARITMINIGSFDFFFLHRGIRSETSVGEDILLRAYTIIVVLLSYARCRRDPFGL